MKLEQQTFLNLQPMKANIQPVANPALNGIAKTADAVTQLLAKQKERNDRLKIENYEENLDTSVKKLNSDLIQNGKTEEFDGIFQERIKELEKNGETFLGKNLYNKWKLENGNSFLNALKVDVDKTKLEFAHKEGLRLAEDKTTSGAYNYVYSTLNEKKLQDEAMETFISENNFTPSEQANLRNIYQTKKEFNQLDIWLDEDPQKIIETLKDSENFQTVQPRQRNSYIEKAQRNINAREGTLLDGKINELLTEFNFMAQEDPGKANAIYQAVLERPYDAQKKYGLDAKSVMNLTNYFKNVLDNGLVGQQKNTVSANIEFQYKLFDIKNGVINNDDKNKIEEITNFIGICKDNMETGLLDRSTGEKYLANMRVALGAQVKDPKFAYKDKFYNRTISEEIPSQVKKFAEERVKGTPLEKEFLGQIYEDVYDTMTQNGVNFKATDTASKAMIQQYVQNAFENLLQINYPISTKEANAVITEDDALITYRPENIKSTAEELLDVPLAPMGTKAPLKSNKEEPQKTMGTPRVNFVKEISNGK